MALVYVLLLGLRLAILWLVSMHCLLSTCHVSLILIPFEEPPHLTADVFETCDSASFPRNSIFPLLGLWLWAFARVIKFGRSNFANFRCNLASEKRFSVPAWYGRELPEKLIERRVMMKIFHTFCTSPLPRTRALMCDNVISLWSADYQCRALAKTEESQGSMYDQ